MPQPSLSGVPPAAVAGPFRAGLQRRVVYGRSRDENFHVISPLLPRRLRNDFLSVYAFCRAADDVADESGSAARALEGLEALRRRLDECFAGRPRGAVFAALCGTVTRHRLPREPFDQLLDAFRQDQRVNGYETWSGLIDYCSRSANPVGRIVLRLVGHEGAGAVAMSDATCTALQLVNFWQDVRPDILERDRVFVPEDVARSHGLDLGELRDRVTGRNSGNETGFHASYVNCMRELCGRTEALFDRGADLPSAVGAEVAPAIELFGLGGRAVLRKIRAAGYETYRRRPRLGAATKAVLLARAWAASLVRGRRGAEASA